MRFKLYFLAGLLSIATLTGVYATWKYPTKQPAIEVELPTHLVNFFWEGAEELPELGEEGSNHIALIERMTITSFGMNDQSSFLSDYIEDRIKDSKDTVSSVAPTPGGNLKDLFSTSETQKLDFMMQLYISDDKEIIGCEIYTFASADVPNSIGREVTPVYKTIMKLEDGKWLPDVTYKGKSVSMKYDAKQGGTRITISPKDWVRND